VNVIGLKLQLLILMDSQIIGARLIYLPPYSPDFNPIEEAFSSIKATLQRNERYFTGTEQIAAHGLSIKQLPQFRQRMHWAGLQTVATCNKQ